MNKQKQNYVAPEAQTLVVGFEGMICQSIPGAQASFGMSNATINDQSDESWW